MGPVTNARLTLYDPLWGYFGFDEKVGFVYNDAYTYQSLSKFTITGMFTRHAEGFGDAPSDDTAAFNALVAKFEALEAVFVAAAKGKSPTSYAQWGTADDPRAIKLPAPLKTIDSEGIYTLPESLNAGESSYANYIQYTAVLNQVPLPDGKLTVDGTIVDEGAVQITVAAPILMSHAMVAAKGAALQVRNYQRETVAFQGLLPHDPASGQAYPARTMAWLSSMSSNTVNVAVQRRNSAWGANQQWPNLEIEKPKVDVDYRNRAAQVSVVGRL
jgi:hypothetical protein